MVPSGWEVKKLEDLCAPDAPITYGVLKPGEYCSNGIPLLQIKDLSNGQVSSQDLHLISKELDEEYKRSRILKNDILISLVGTIGRVAKFELSTPANIHRNLGRVRTDYHEFIFHFLNSDVALKLMGDSSSGSSQSALNLSTLRSMKVPFPPFKEQQKITQILSTWDQAISATEKLLENSQQQKKALMQQLLTGKKRLLDENGVTFSEQWKYLKANELFASTSKKQNSEDEELLAVTQDQGVIPRSLLERRVVMPEGSTSGYKLVVPGNFIISLRSFQGGLEYSCYRGLVSPAYTVLKSVKEICDDFYKHYYKSYDFIGHLAVAVIGIRDGKQISYEDFSFLKLPYPRIAEQEKIAKVLSLVDQEIETLQKKLNCLKQEKKALMQQLLTGKKRVKVAA